MRDPRNWRAHESRALEAKRSIRAARVLSTGPPLAAPQSVITRTVTRLRVEREDLLRNENFFISHSNW
jgi:hypothetical protein